MTIVPGVAFPSMRAVRMSTLVLWSAIAWASAFGCIPIDGPTEESLAPHFIAWMVIGMSAAIGCLPFMARESVPSWCRAAVVVVCNVATADVLVSYAVSLCLLKLTLESIEDSWVYVPASITTIAVTLSAVSCWIPVAVAGIAAGLRRSR